jgi:cobalt-zinc-cadmium efflux system membrane fusion protein
MIAGCGDGQHQDDKEIAAIENSQDGQDFSEDIASANESGLKDWCAEHLVPESQCTKCNPDLISGFKESGDWCAGHGIPESHCRLCNPEIRFPQEDFLGGITFELEESEIDVELNFRPNATSCATDGAIIQFASSSTAERAGINVKSVQAGRYESIIEAPAEIVFDETEATVVASVIPALVSRWLVSPGDIVLAGDELAVLKSPDIAGLKSTLVASRARYEVERKELERHKEMRERNLISEADLDLQSASVEEAGAEYTGIRGMLMAAGLTESGIEEIENSRDFSNEFVLRSPANGVLVKRIAQLGELMDAGSAFAIVADPSSMWIEARLTEKQMKEARIGDQLSFSSDGNNLDKVGGEIIWISRFLDPHTRTGTVRAVVLNRNHRLYAGEFGRARILQAENTGVSLVPKDAVQWEGCCNVVFVMESESRYRPRKVQLFDGEGPYYQVADGVRPGEMVVVSGAFLLKTELKKSSIGAGCCGLEPVG